MSRKLPEDDPVKRRLCVFKRIYQHIDHFQSLLEEGRLEMPGIITLDTGEDVYLGDMLVGLPSLPRRQREAFELICLQGYTQAAARDKMLPNSQSSTPVQQYSDSALVRMVAKYDEKQSGRTRWRRFMTTALHPIVKRGLEQTRKDILQQMEGLKMALKQVEEILTVPVPESSKPRLDEMAKSMVADERALA